MRRIVTLSLCLFLINTFCSAQFQEVSIPGSQVRTVISKNVKGQEYSLQIMLPAGYEKSSKKYPVVYLMDSQWDFSLVTALYGQQYYDGFIPQLIIVGVTWAGKHPNPDSLRARDYTPTKEARLPQSGGADAFLSCLKNEIFPFAEAAYRIDKADRTLMGCSLGGLFTLYTLFTQPDLFQRYVAASPAIGWDNGILSPYATKYFSSKELPPAKLFLCVGGVERNAPAYEAFVNTMQTHKPSSLQMHSRVLENTGHSGTKGEGYARGLQAVFKKPALTLTTTQLKKLTGHYLLADGSVIDVKEEDNHLVVYASPTNKYTLYAAGENDFYATSEFLNLHFTDKGFELERYGSTQSAIKK